MLTTTFALADPYTAPHQDWGGATIRHNRIMVQTKTLLSEFLAFRGPVKEQKEQAEALLPCEDLPPIFKLLSQKDKGAFIEKLCQVHHLYPQSFSPINLPFSLSFHPGLL